MPFWIYRAKNSLFLRGREVEMSPALVDVADTEEEAKEKVSADEARYGVVTSPDGEMAFYGRFRCKDCENSMNEYAEHVRAWLVS